MNRRGVVVLGTWACLGIGIAACVSPPASQIPFAAAARPPAGMALVYVFRRDARAAEVDMPFVRIDGKPVAALQSVEYSAVYLPAGRHTVTTDADDRRDVPPAPAYAFELAAGQVAALALDYVGAPPPQSAVVPTKYGKMSLPRTEWRTGAPFSWSFVGDIERNALYDELGKRRYRAAPTP